MDYNIFIYFVLFSVLIATTKTYESCNSSVDCPIGYFCNFSNDSSNELGRPQCNLCINCSQYNRQSLVECATTLDQCGTCFTGYNFSNQNLGFCELNNSDHVHYPDNSSSNLLASTSSNGTTNQIIVFAVLLPSSALVVVVLTLLLSFLYRLQIRKNQTKDDRHFAHKEPDVIV